MAASVLTTAAQAGGPVVVAEEPQLAYVQTVQQPTADWSGFYAGLGYGVSSGDIDFTNPDVANKLDDGHAASAFVGYLVQRDALVYGAELAYTGLDKNTVTGFADEIDQTIDLKGKVGYAANRALFYGVLGYSVASFDTAGGSWDPAGVNYGLGMDYLVTDRMTVGLEYLARDLTGDNPDGLGQQAKIDLDTVSLRVGFQF
ncbi:outer membrane protein [Rhodobacter ferrooxidans]|uniref:outer membrane protein n=1 Tax=Rhodobacter ferrooxidans TaxID=371731 RepID=UPI000303E962|nr:outer membrane beta-barrel protein [Rhodobacter sp. SW2]